MPELSRSQFQPRLFDPGPASAGPHRGEGAPIADANTNTRGPAGHGQFAMNFEVPSEPLLAGAGGIMGVDEDNDPSWDRTAWGIGGRNRDEPLIANAWESAPVVDIPASRELRSNQIRAVQPKTGRTYEGKAYRPLSTMDTHDDMSRKWDTTPISGPEMAEVAVGSSHVDSLRKSARFSDAADPHTHNSDESEKLPWVMRVEEEPGNPKDYVMEGHHRTVAQRTRGEGNVRAHMVTGRPGHSMKKVLADFYHQPQKLYRSQP